MKKNTNKSTILFSKSPFDSDLKYPLPTERIGIDDMVIWGEKNKYPYFLYDLYANGSALLQSLVNTTLDFVTGADYKDNTNISGFDTNLKKMVLDYILCGQAGVEIIRNMAGNIKEVNALDMLKLRTNKTNDVFYYKDWTDSKDKVEILNKFHRDSSEARTVAFLKNPMAKNVYAQPYWSSAIRSAVIDDKIGNFHLNEINNNFLGSAIVNFIGTGDEEQLDILSRSMKENFSGSDNAGKFMVTMSSDKDSVPQVIRLTEDNLDKRYETLAERVKMTLYTAFRLTPALVGDPSISTGFNSQEYAESSELFMKAIARPIQTQVEEFFYNIFGYDAVILRDVKVEENTTTTENTIENNETI